MIFLKIQQTLADAGVSAGFYQAIEPVLYRQRYDQQKDFIDSAVFRRQVAFVESGLLACWRETEDGDDVLVDFAVPGDLLFSFAGFFGFRSMAASFLKAVEPSELVCLSVQDAKGIWQQQPEAKFALNHFVGRKEERFQARTRMLLLKPPARFDAFCKAFPDTWYKLSNKMICAYLRISETSLLRAKRQP